MAGHIDAVITPYYLLMHAWIAAAGTSATALRLPSVLAMAVAAVVTSVIGRRLASTAQLPAPAATGVLAGLLFAAAPQVAGYGQGRQISWLPRPHLGAVDHLVVSFAGSRPLAPLVALLVVAGVTASVTDRRRVTADMVTVAAPWLLLPALILLAAAQVHP